MFQILTIYTLSLTWICIQSADLYNIDLLSPQPYIRCNTQQCTIRVDLRSNFLPYASWTRTFPNQTVKVIDNSIPGKYTGKKSVKMPGCQTTPYVYCSYSFTLVISYPTQTDYGKYEGIFSQTDKGETSLPFCLPDEKYCLSEPVSRGADNTAVGETEEENGNAPQSDTTLTINKTMMYVAIGGVGVVVVVLVLALSFLALKRKRKPRRESNSSKNNDMDNSIAISSHMYAEIPSIGYEEPTQRDRLHSHQYTVPVTEGTPTYQDPTMSNIAVSPPSQNYIRRDTQGYLEPTITESLKLSATCTNPTYIDSRNDQKPKQPITPTYSNPESFTDFPNRPKRPVTPTYSNPESFTDKENIQSSRPLLFTYAHPVQPRGTTEHQQVLVRQSSNHLKVPVLKGKTSFRKTSSSDYTNVSRIFDSGSQKKFKASNYENTAIGK